MNNKHLTDKLIYLETMNELLRTELNDLRDNLDIGLLRKIKELEFQLSVAKSVIIYRSKDGNDLSFN